MPKGQIDIQNNQLGCTWCLWRLLEIAPDQLVLVVGVEKTSKSKSALYSASDITDHSKMSEENASIQ